MEGLINRAKWPSMMELAVGGRKKKIVTLPEGEVRGMHASLSLAR